MPPPHRRGGRASHGGVTPALPAGRRQREYLLDGEEGKAVRETGGQTSTERTGDIAGRTGKGVVS